MTESTPETHPSREQFVLRLGELRRPLEPGSNYTIGKEDNCDVRLGHGTISPIHCRLQVTEDGVIVHDLNSLCGTKIDGEPIMDGPWVPGAILEVGEIRIELETQTVAVTPMVTVKGIPAAGLLAHRPEPAFGDIMLDELKRTPWLALSVVAHAVVMLLMWFFAEAPVKLGSDAIVISMEDQEPEQEIKDDRIQEETVTEKEMKDEEFNEVEVEEIEEEMIVDESDIVDTDTGLANIDDLMTKTGTGLDDILKAGKSALSGRFKKTVAGLRKNGLEIVFVFDSTGSMGTVLQAAKDRIEKMVSVLVELVPYSRIGVITYRDEGEGSDSYLMKTVPLSRDFYRAMNFLQLIYAGGGGDEPEAVYDGLRQAIQGQKWGATAKRMVILIGDAPPHKRTEGQISSMVKSFSRNKRSHVHAIITRPSGGSTIAKATQRTFKRIADDGGGQALEFEDEAKIMKAVMNLAFGSKDSRSIDEVYKLADARQKKIAAKAIKLLAPENRDRLMQEFKQPVVSHEVMKAILQKPTADVLELMVDIASKRSFNAAGKHAAAYILRRAMSSVDDPPVDPLTGTSMSERRANRMKSMIRKRFK